MYAMYCNNLGQYSEVLWCPAFCGGLSSWAIVLFPETLAQNFSMDKEVPREFMGLVIVGLVMAGVSYTNSKKRKAERD